MTEEYPWCTCNHKKPAHFYNGEPGACNLCDCIGYQPPPVPDLEEEEEEFPEFGENMIPPPIPWGMELSEAKRRIMAALHVLSDSAYKLTPALAMRFEVHKPRGFRRHQVVLTLGGQLLPERQVIERFWSWDRADDLAGKLNNIKRTSF